jgi:hypothetical protein
MKCLCLGVLLAAAAAVLSAQPLSRQEIEGALRYDKHGDPAFTVVPAGDLAKQIRITAARSYAVFGYNTPAVVVALPPTDNSAYAVVKFLDARPLSASGKALPHEIEQGLYENETHATQIRFIAAGGGRTLVPLARATGRVAVKYPLEIRTAPVKAGSPDAARLGISIDGPYVKYREDLLGLPDAASFTGIEPLRAYDAAGKRLERYDGVQKSEFANGATLRSIAFWGPVASVRYDTVLRWSETEVPFDLPAAAFRPPGKEGSGP